MYFYKFIKNGSSNIGTISKPAILTLNKTFCELLLDETFILDHYLEIASEITDSKEKIKYIAAGIFANLYYNPVNSFGLSPITPIIGETLQGEKSNGSKIYVEIIDSDTYLLNIINKKYKVFKKIQSIITPSFVYNELNGTNIGEFYIEFDDNTKYNIILPKNKITNLLSKRKNFSIVKDFEILDSKNNLKIKFIDLKPEKSSLNKMKNWFSSKKEEEYIPNSYKIILLENNKEIQTGISSLTRFFNINNNLYWIIDQELNFEKWKIENQNLILNSSSFIRKEKQLINEEKFEECDLLIQKIDKEEIKLKKLLKR